MHLCKFWLVLEPKEVKSGGRPKTRKRTSEELVDIVKDLLKKNWDELNDDEKIQMQKIVNQWKESRNKTEEQAELISQWDLQRVESVVAKNGHWTDFESAEVQVILESWKGSGNLTEQQKELAKKFSTLECDRLDKKKRWLEQFMILKKGTLFGGFMAGTLLGIATLTTVLLVYWLFGLHYNTSRNALKEPLEFLTKSWPLLLLQFVLTSHFFAVARYWNTPVNVILSLFLQIATLVVFMVLEQDHLLAASASWACLEVANPFVLCGSFGIYTYFVVQFKSYPVLFVRDEAIDVVSDKRFDLFFVFSMFLNIMLPALFGVSVWLSHSLYYWIFVVPCVLGLCSGLLRFLYLQMKQNSRLVAEFLTDLAQEIEQLRCSKAKRVGVGEAKLTIEYVTRKSDFYFSSGTWIDGVKPDRSPSKRQGRGPMYFEMLRHKRKEEDQISKQNMHEDISHYLKLLGLKLDHPKYATFFYVTGDQTKRELLERFLRQHQRLLENGEIQENN